MIFRLFLEKLGGFFSILERILRDRENKPTSEPTISKEDLWESGKGHSAQKIAPVPVTKRQAL